MHSNQREFTMLFERFARLGYTFSPEVKEEIMATTYLETYKKGETILPYKHVCEHVYFITQGVTAIKIEQSSKEYIQWLMMEGDVFISVMSFFFDQPSNQRIVALEDTQCIVMPKKIQEEIGRRYPEFKDLRSRLTEYYYAESDERERIRFMTTTERCAFMFENYRKLYERVNNYHMASFLAMELQTFSRVKAKMLREGGI